MSPFFCLVIINNLCPIKLLWSLIFLYLNEVLCSDETSLGGLARFRSWHLRLYGPEVPLPGCNNVPCSLWSPSEHAFDRNRIACRRFASVPGVWRCRWASCVASVRLQQPWPRESSGCSNFVLRGVRWFSSFSTVHTSVCEHSYFFTACAGYRSQHAIYVFFASAFLFQLLLSFWGVQWNPNPPSCAQLLSKMLKYVFIQLILPSVASAKEGWLMQNYMPFLLFLSCLNPLSQVFGLLHLFSICEFWRSSNSVFVSDDVLAMWTLAKKSKTGKNLICNPSVRLKVLAVQAGVLREQCCQLSSHHDAPQTAWTFNITKQNLSSKWSLLCSARYSARYQMNFPHYLYKIQEIIWVCLSTEGPFYFSKLLMEWNISVGSPSIPAQSSAWRNN